jgi:ABC-type glycerol-3-phosphate transport system substrate-binding protein
MKNNKLFQYVVTGIFIFFIILGAILFSTYRSSTSTENAINITMWGTLPEDEFSAFVTRYFSDRDLKYTVNYVEREPSNFDRDLVEAIASGSGPDAIILPEDMVVRYSNKIYTIPYEVMPELNFKQTFVQEGELYLNASGVLALPFSIDPLVMYWNRDIFNNVSVTRPPTTWAEITLLTSKIIKKDQAKNILTSVVALGEFSNVTNAKNILSTMFVQAGNPIVRYDSTDGTFSSVLKESGTKTSPTALAFQFYTNFSNPVRPEYSWNRAMPNSIDAFANGDLAIYFGFASEFLTIKNKNPNLNFDVALLPQIQGAKVNSTFGNMLGLAIMKSSANPAGSYSVISALTSAEAVPFWKDIFNIPSARRDILSVPEKSAIKTVFNQSAVISKGWLDPNNTETSKIFQEMVESYTTGRSTVEDALNIASNRLDVVLNSK